MKRKISDLMDQYRGDYPELPCHTPLSSRRIKEMTMKQIVGKEKKGKRMGFRLLVVAAVIACLSMTVLATEDSADISRWFRAIFEIQLEKEQSVTEDSGVAVGDTVSSGALDAVNELSQGFRPQTKEDQGTTVTLQAAYGADYLLHLIFCVEAPEGTVLPDGIVYDFCDYNAIDYSQDDYFRMLYPGTDAPYDYISYQMEIETLPDENPADHYKEFHVTIHGQPGTECKFNDGYRKYFSLAGIYQQLVNANEDEDGYVLLAPGEFTFDVGLLSSLERIQLKEAEGFRYGGEKHRTWTHEGPCHELCKEQCTGEIDPEKGLPVHTESYTYEVEVESVAISSLGVEWRVNYTSNQRSMSFGLDFRVVMKDGTSPRATAAGGESDNGRQMNGTSYFTVPIDVGEVDYIIIGDEELGEIKILPLNE